MLRGIGVQNNFFEQLVSYGSRPGVCVGVACGARLAAKQPDEHHGSALQQKVPSPSGASVGTVKRFTAASVIRHSDFIESLR